MVYLMNKHQKTKEPEKQINTQSFLNFPPCWLLSAETLLQEGQAYSRSRVLGT